MGGGIQRRFTTRPAAFAGLVASRAAGGLPTITGYAAVFYRAGDPGTQYELEPGVVERIMPGAFDKAMRRDDVAALFNHQTELVLGRTSSGTCRLTADAIGLRFEIDPPNTTVGRDVAELLARGDVRGSSFAFVVADGGERLTHDGALYVREVRDVVLYDVGPVTYPAYPSTTSGIGGGGGRGGSGGDRARADRDWLEIEMLLLDD